MECPAGVGAVCGEPGRGMVVQVLGAVAAMVMGTVGAVHGEAADGLLARWACVRRTRCSQCAGEGEV